MILDGCTDRKETNPTIYVSCESRYVCHLYHSDLKMVFAKSIHLPKFTSGPVLMKVFGLRLTEAEIQYRKLMLFG